jgi:hypothetical protein
MEELPDKIYITQNWLAGQGWWSVQFERRSEADVEYIRTDRIFTDQADELRRQGFEKGMIAGARLAKESNNEAIDDIQRPTRMIYEKYTAVGGPLSADFDTRKIVRELWQAIKDTLGEE